MRARINVRFAGKNKRMKRILSAFALIFCTVVVVASVSPRASAADTSPSRELLAAYVAGCEEADTLPAMTAVAAVILNRLADPRCPDTLTGCAASLGLLPSPAPGGLELYAASLAIGGVDPTGGATGFTVGDVPEGAAVTFSVGRMRFIK